MSHEGILLIARAALVAFLIFATAVCRALVGPNRKRSEIMMLGTLGGMALGVFAAYVLTPWLTFDASAVTAPLGIILGWLMSWPFARRIPREVR